MGVFPNKIEKIPLREPANNTKFAAQKPIKRIRL